MSSYCYKKVKNKKNKALYTQLACLDDNRRDAVLSEYMEACKMVYRIKATLNYTWKVSNNLDDVIKLFQEDYTFIKMQDKVKTAFLNVFATTNPYESVIGEIFNRRELLRRQSGKLSLKS